MFMGYDSRSLHEDLEIIDTGIDAQFLTILKMRRSITIAGDGIHCESIRRPLSSVLQADTYITEKAYMGLLSAHFGFNNSSLGFNRIESDEYIKSMTARALVALNLNGLEDRLKFAGSRILNLIAASATGLRDSILRDFTDKSLRDDEETVSQISELIRTRDYASDAILYSMAYSPSDNVRVGIGRINQALKDLYGSFPDLQFAVEAIQLPDPGIAINSHSQRALS